MSTIVQEPIILAESILLEEFFFELGGKWRFELSSDDDSCAPSAPCCSHFKVKRKEGKLSDV